MTVIVSKPAVNLREELASLRNQGGYQEQQFYFENAVTNGTFDTDVSGWSSYVATISNVSSALRITLTGNNGWAAQGITTVVGKTYTVSFDLNAKSVTTFWLQVGTTTNADSGRIADGVFTSTGSHSLTFTATATTLYVFLRPNGGSGSTADVDNISVFEVDANDDVVHRMPKGWVPKDVFEDGLLQREGSAHDYDVVYDGFDYYVKPAVAPSATTQTCVIGVKA